MSTTIIKECKNLHLDDEQDIQMRLKNHEESSYNLELDLLTILHRLGALYPRRNSLD